MLYETELLRLFVTVKVPSDGGAAETFGALTFGALTFGLATPYALTFGALTFGALTFGALTFGALTFGALTFGALTFGALTFGALTLGALTFGSYSSTLLMLLGSLGRFPFGSTKLAGTVPSAFRRMNPDSPPAMGVPPKALISFTFTRMLAVALLETANTVRATPVCGAIAMSMLPSGNRIPLPFVAGNGGLGTGLGGTSCANDANPFTG